MAVHAGFGRWNPCKRRRLDGCMTVTAVDAIVAGVVKMAELNGLFDEFLGACYIGRPADDYEEADRPAGQKQDADNAGSREGIGATAEYLRHRTLTVGCPSGGRSPYSSVRAQIRRGFFPVNDQSVLRCEKRCKLWHRTSTVRAAQFQPGMWAFSRVSVSRAGLAAALPGEPFQGRWVNGIDHVAGWSVAELPKGVESRAERLEHP
jgi:hypothetical protein